MCKESEYMECINTLEKTHKHMKRLVRDIAGINISNEGYALDTVGVGIELLHVEREVRIADKTKTDE